MTAPDRSFGAPPVSGPAWRADSASLARQIGTALISARPGMTELSLAPEELGRLHIAISGQERPHLVIWAERPETLEMLRRHSDALTSALQEAGVEGGVLDFRDGAPPQLSRPQSGTQTDGDEPAALQQIAVPPALASGATAMAGTRRVDVRL